MSGGLKGVKKVFKKVAKTVSKVLPVALAVGAVVFSAGSAFGALPSWGAAVTSLTGSGPLGSILAGAVTQAGYGSLAGMAVSGITGGDIMKGAQYGAAAGAVTGGITGAAGGQIDPLDNSPTTQSASNPTQGGGLNIQTASGIPGSAAGLPAAAAAAPAASGAAPGLLGPGGFVERNGELIGGVVSGVGKGLLAAGEAEDEGKSQMQLLRERQKLIANNYGGNAGLLGEGSTDYIDDLGVPYEYALNPKSGMIEKVSK
jgi:hypothetical protein